MEITFLKAVICRLKSTYRLSINCLYWLATAVQATVHVGGVLSIKPEQRQKIYLFHRAQFQPNEAHIPIIIIVIKVQELT